MSGFVQHVPLSAVLILVVLIWRGSLACRDKVLPVSRAFLLPFVMLGWSLWHIAATQPGSMLLCWGGSAVVMAAVCRGLRYPGGLLLDSTGRSVFVQGSPVSLVLMLLLYAAHFVEGAFRAMHQGVEVPAALMCGVTLVYGSVAGVLLARLFKLTGLIARKGYPASVLPR